MGGWLTVVGLVPSLAASSAVLPAPLGRADRPPSPSRTRRDALQIALRAWTVGAGAAIAGLVHGEAERLATAPRPDELREGDELYRLRSQNELAPRRAALDADWRELRRSPPTREQTAQAFEEVVRVRDAIREARALAEAQRWAELGALLPADTVPALERAATLLAASASLTADQRAAIGWQWGACGWRRCGAQADAAQALSKLRANLGMVVPLEALFYLDVALRSTDEIGAPDARKTPLNSHPRREALGCSPSHPRPGGASASGLWSSHPPDLLSLNAGLWPSASSRVCCRRAPRARKTPRRTRDG